MTSSRIYIDPEFRQVVETHLAGNLVVAPTGSPLILGIFGPPGEGKTYQVDRICGEYGLATTTISPGELESENAGHPGQLLRKEYLKVGSSGRNGVLIVHDIDTVLGNWGSLVQYTVNRQVVFGQMMALCDYPTMVAGTSCQRVPIVMTGNNPAILYGPLLRPGRTRMYGWKPSTATRVPIVAGIFPELATDQIARFLDLYPDRPVSFWADVRAAVWEEAMARWIVRDGRSSLRAMIQSGQKMSPSPEVFSHDSIAAAAIKLDATDIRESSFV